MCGLYNAAHSHHHITQACRPNLCKSPNIHMKLCEIDNTYFVDCCNPRIEIPHNIAYNRIIK